MHNYLSQLPHCQNKQCQSKNFKIIHSSNTTFSNISNKMRLSQILKLDSNSQNINHISRNSGKTQFGNFYLGKLLNINCFGRQEGMAGGSGKPPTNF